MPGNWLYRHGNRCYTVGFYAPDGSWNTAADFATPAEAAVHCAFLNGNVPAQPRRPPSETGGRKADNSWPAIVVCVLFGGVACFILWVNSKAFGWDVPAWGYLLVFLMGTGLVNPFHTHEIKER